MIRRGSSRKTPSAVNAAENEVLKPSGGIAVNAGPESLATVVDACNFRLRDDGTLALRKPDIKLLGRDSDSDVIIPLNDGAHILTLTDDGFPHVSDVFGSEAHDVCLKYRVRATGATVRIDSEGFSVAASESDLTGRSVFISPSAKATWTGDSAVFPAKVSRSRLSGLEDPALYPAGYPDWVPRYVSVYFDADADEWVMEVESPEPNTLASGESGASFEPNLLLDNPYALKDLYGYGYVAAHGIVAYQDPDSDDSYEDDLDLINEGSFAKDFKEALFKVAVGNGRVYVYANAHISLADLSKVANSSSATPTAESLSELDGEIVCGARVGDTAVSYDKVCSAFIPAYTPILIDDVDTSQRETTITIDIMLYKRGQGYSPASFYAYPKDVPLEELPSAKPRTFAVAEERSAISITVRLLDGKVVEAPAFSLGYDSKGVYIEPDADAATSDLYALSQSEFESAAAAKAMSIPYPQGERLYLDPSEQSWEFWYKEWDYRQHSSVLSGVTVKELTEKVGSPRFRMVTKLNPNDRKPLILKAMMSFSKSMRNFYAVWEYSDDGVSWSVCPEFIRKHSGSLIEVPIYDASKSDESLEKAGDYTKYVKCVPISASSGDDLAANRPDVLEVTTTPRTSSFRFSVYRYSKAADPAKGLARCVVSRDALSSGFLDIPKMGDVHITGTPIRRGMEYMVGIFAAFPDSLSSSYPNVTIKYGVANDVSKELTDSDCTNAISATSASGYLYCGLTEANLIPDSSNLTHSVRLRFAAFSDNAPIPGYHVDAIYMYSSGTLPNLFCRSTHSGSAASQRSKFTSFPEPVVEVISESGSLSYKDTEYDLADLPGGYFPTSATGNSPIKATYAMRCAVRNPSNAWMLVSFSVSVPAADGSSLYTLGTSPGSANLTIAGASYEESFTAISAARLIPAFARGTFRQCALIPPHGSAEVSYSYDVQSRALPPAAVASLHLYDLAKDMAFFLEATSLSGRMTLSANPGYVWSLQCYTGAQSNDYHAVQDASYYTDGYPRPVYVQSDWQDSVGDLSANGSYPIPGSSDAYVQKAVAVSSLPYSAEATDLSTETVAYSGFPNVVGGRHLYCDGALLTYGVEGHGGSLYVSEADSFITPLQNEITFGYGSDVTAIVPWRDYVMVFTENATYMLLRSGSDKTGYSIRTVNAQVGIPKTDGDSVQAILNGILFKSGDKAYVYVPGRYSTVDTMLNIRRISDPIEGLLREGSATLSFVQDDEWHVFQGAHELVYDYSKNTWLRNTHPFAPTGVMKMGTSWHILFAGRDAAISYGRDYDELSVPNGSEYYDLAPLSALRYGDYVKSSAGLPKNLDDFSTNPSGHAGSIQPFAFSADTGQRSGRPTVDKQFLEAKLNFVSLDDKDAFPLRISAYADGMPHAHAVDANTDSPLWRDSKNNDAGAASTSFGDADTSNVGIMRQMFIKYSGKGKTLRLALSGTSESRFAIHSMESRYRVLPKKQ